MWESRGENQEARGKRQEARDKRQEEIFCGMDIDGYWILIDIVTLPLRDWFP
jgi:hypothetical protein